MNLRDLRLRLRALFRPRRADNDVDDELAFHVAMETRKHEAAGLGAEEAHALARKKFGSTALAADECRDTRGISLVDDCIRDIRYAVRSFVRARLASLTIVVTVGLGLGLVAVVFTVFNVLMFRVDAVPNPHELFAVSWPTGFDERVRLTRTQYDSLRRETDVFSGTFAMLPDIDSRIDGRMMSGSLVTGNFFQVLDVNAALGRTLIPEDDERGRPRPVMVLSHRGWSRLFENDPAVLGRTLVVNNAPYEVVGVMPDGFRGLDPGPPDYWAPLGLLAQFRPIHAGHEDGISLDVIGRLKPGVTRATAIAGLAVWDSRRTSGVADRNRPNITLTPRQGTIGTLTEGLLVFSPLFVVFGLILMIGCANVANLLLARAFSRQREIGIRLSLGASRRRIVRQLLTESLLLALAAAVLGFAISRLVIEATLYAVTSTMAPEIAEVIRISAPPADWRVAVFLVAGAMISTVFFGLVPALQATRLELTRTVRGDITNDPRPNRARNALIALQVTASALLLICSAVFLRSALAAATVDPGMRTSDTVMVDVVNEPFRDAMVKAVATEPAVAEVAASWPDVSGSPRSALARTADSPVQSAVPYRFVSPEYFSVLGITVLRGRVFTPAERTADSAVAIVSETVARELWPRNDAVGQILHLAPDPNSATRADEPSLVLRTFTVIGVARDVGGFRIPDFHAPTGVYLPINSSVAEASLTVRVLGDPEQARRALLQRLITVDPNMGQVMTLKTMARMETYLLQIAFWFTAVLGGLALALTLSGLFSVLSYLVEQRKKEISVRMALGATARNVAGMVLSQTSRPVGCGLIAGAGLAWGLATLLTALLGARTVQTVVHVLDPIAYAASVLLIIAACFAAASFPAWRAARIDPSATLRQD